MTTKGPIPWPKYRMFPSRPLQGLAGAWPISMRMALICVMALGLSSQAIAQPKGSPESVLADIGIPLPGDEYWQHGDAQLWADEQIRALHVADDTLFAAGQFLTIGLTPANRIAALSDGEWAPIGEGLDDSAKEVTVIDGPNWGLYACGQFTHAGGGDARRAARWDGSSWSGLASFDATVHAACEYEGDLIFAGGFYYADDQLVWGIARRQDGVWGSIGEGFNQIVLELAVYNGELIAGGTFTATSSGATPLGYIARWDGAQWQSLGDGVDGYVNSLRVIDGKLYVGGSFEYSGGEWLGHIATWDGSNWESIGGGIETTGPGVGVAAIAKYQGNLYVGGQFTYAGGVWAKNIAFWDGITWNRLGSGTNGWVFALAVHQDGLYVGGWFQSAGGLPAENIALWQPSTTSTPTAESGIGPVTDFRVSPNPFGPSTTFRFNTAKQYPVSIEIYNVAGRCVKRIPSQRWQVGEHAIEWFGNDDEGNRIASGVYYAVLSSGKYRATQKIVLVR